MSFSIPFRFAAVALLLWSVQAGAADSRQKCEALAKVIHGLDQVASGLQQTKTIEKGSELDKALGELVDSLENIAAAEGNTSFSTAVEELGDAWEKLDRPGFDAALARVVANVDRIIRSDCN